MKNDFSRFISDEAMLQNLKDLGYAQMTSIQEVCLPLVLEGKDVTAQAKTGSGKTAAFGLPLLLRLHVRKMSIQSMVLCPTRELAEQVAGELRKFARSKHNIKILLLCGGVPCRQQRFSLEHGAHIIVGTPGRILQHLEEGALFLDSVETLVLDEADRMLDMGFFEDIEKIIAKTPAQRQTLLFSATFPKEIESICAKVQCDAVTISVTAEEVENKIEQIFYEVNRDDKYTALKAILLTHQPKSAIIFCKTKIGVSELQDELYQDGFDVLSLHGDLEQIDRDESLIQFANGSMSILVATDLASRGLDIKDVQCVINYDLPNTPEIYTHRIGRTARMGKEGLAISFYEPFQKEFLEELNAANISFTCQPYESLTPKDISAYRSEWVTLCIDGGKKQKVRAGDILGTLTKDVGLHASSIGKIDITDKYAYVAIERKYADKAFEALGYKTIKGRAFRVWKLD
ncbi:MAG: ATP-dependent RNA helicase DbpA [Sulfurospirillaceae bacterium]|nr:ATP-dependent RNA helicase DbpA [Sulfurospirillaceae bacterium]MDD2826555.1 ATP-dependent RNA helicase DbpA [Sulfurospirillaceae bacterium]